MYLRLQMFVAALFLPACTTPGWREKASPVSPVAAIEKVGSRAAGSRIELTSHAFTLPNGLKAVVHEDHKAPIVAVTVWYDVGSRDEPDGKHGFAHLFEHLMFNGSANVRGDYLQIVGEIGGSSVGGGTIFDRTTYTQVVPTAALQRLLFLESDRMGYLMGGVDQGVLDRQRDVVKNEVRQGQDQPLGLALTQLVAGLLPTGHPYHHMPAGSMADLDRASLQDVRQWFEAYYAPSNATIVLAGDINPGQARSLLEKYFGDLPKSPPVHREGATLPAPSASASEVTSEKISAPRVYRAWIGPPIGAPDFTAVELLAKVLAGGADARLQRRLVDERKLATKVSMAVEPFRDLSLIYITADAGKGVESRALEAALDEALAELLSSEPTFPELEAIQNQYLAQTLRNLQSVSYKARVLAREHFYGLGAGSVAERLSEFMQATPRQVREVAARLFQRPSYTLRVDPGERPRASAPLRAIDQVSTAVGADVGAAKPLPPRGPAPSIGPVTAISFPAVQRARLSNGVEVSHVRRRGLPIVDIVVEFDAGTASDTAATRGVHNLVLDLIKRGSRDVHGAEFARATNQLGATIEATATVDRTSLSLSALAAQLGPSLDLLASVLIRPNFDPAHVERSREHQLAAVQRELRDPWALTRRTLSPSIYGESHPYGNPPTGTGDLKALEQATPAAVLQFHQAWLRPDNAHIFSVGDIDLNQLVTSLETHLASWQAPTTPRGRKELSRVIPTAKPRIILIDHPGASQSLIYAGEVLAERGATASLPLLVAEQVLGNDSAARINSDLRQAKGWSYRSDAWIDLREGPVPFLVHAPVQSDRTGAAIKAILEQVAQFTGTRGTTAAELQRARTGNLLRSAGSFETSGQILETMRSNALLGRSDSYPELLPKRYQELTREAVDRAARAVLDGRRLTWVVVGDVKTVRPQLRKLGLPVDVMQPQ